jgi:hypothetical protein
MAALQRAQSSIIYDARLDRFIAGSLDLFCRAADERLEDRGNRCPDRGNYQA